MKVCPTCSEVYKDDDINFCLADGTTLLKKKNGKAAKHSRWNDVVAIIIAAVAVLVLLCLITSNSEDRSLISTGAGLASTRNWIGVVGANIAAVCFSLVGWTAYLLPLLIALVAWRVFQANTLVPRASRTAGFIFFTVSLAGLTTLFGGYGAIVGEAAAQGTAHFIGKIGAGILLAAIFASSVILITNFTLAGFLSHFEVAWQNFKIRVDEWRDKRRAGRSGEIDAAKKRADRRREKRSSTAESMPPTISVGDVEAMVAAAAIGRATPLSDDATDSIPTIDAGANPYATRKEAVVPSDLKEIPIMPIRHTGDLDKEVIVDEDKAAEPERKRAEQSF